MYLRVSLLDAPTTAHVITRRPMIGKANVLSPPRTHVWREVNDALRRNETSHCRLRHVLARSATIRNTTRKALQPQSCSKPDLSMDHHTQSSKERTRRDLAVAPQPSCLSIVLHSLPLSNLRLSLKLCMPTQDARVAPHRSTAIAFYSMLPNSRCQAHGTHAHWLQKIPIFSWRSYHTTQDHKITPKSMLRPIGTTNLFFSAWTHVRRTANDATISIARPNLQLTSGTSRNAECNVAQPEEKCGSQTLGKMLIWGARCGHHHPKLSMRHNMKTTSTENNSSARERPNKKNVQRRYRGKFLVLWPCSICCRWAILVSSTNVARSRDHARAGDRDSCSTCCAMSHHCNRNASHPSPFTLERFWCKCFAIDALATPHVITPRSKLCATGKMNVLFSPWTLVGRTAKRHNETKRKKPLFARTSSR